MATRETVTVVRPPAKGRFGDPVPGTAAEIPVEGCLFAPGPSGENLDGANQVDATGTVFAPAGTVVRPSDRLRVRGELYEVAGKPMDWGTSGVQIPLRQVTG